MTYPSRQVELEETLRTCIKEHDKAGAGRITLPELRAFLHSSHLHLSREWINMLWMAADPDPDGSLALEGFVTTFHRVFAVIVCSDVAQWLRDEMVADLPARLLRACRALDPDGAGLLRPHELVAAVRNADLGIPLFHILSVVSEAEPAAGREADCAVAYRPFIDDHAAPIIAKLISEDTAPVDPDAALTAAQLAAAAAAAEGALGAPRADFVAALDRAFAAADPAAAGRLAPPALRAALSASGLGFTPRQEVMLLALAAPAPPPPAGDLLYAGLAARGTEAILWEARLERIYDAIEARA